LFALIVTGGAVAAATLDIQEGRAPSVDRAWKQSLDRAVPLITANLNVLAQFMILMILVGIGVGIAHRGGPSELQPSLYRVASCLCLIGLYTGYPFVDVVPLVENLGGRRALQRGNALMQGRSGRILASVMPLATLACLPLLIPADGPVARLFVSVTLSLSTLPLSVATALLYRATVTEPTAT
jgi:hypothetical protein